MSRESYIYLDTKVNTVDIPKLQPFIAKSPNDNRIVSERLAGGIRMPLAVNMYMMQHKPEVGESIIESFTPGEFEEFTMDTIRKDREAAE